MHFSLLAAQVAASPLSPDEPSFLPSFLPCQVAHSVSPTSRLNVPLRPSVPPSVRSAAGRKRKARLLLLAGEEHARKRHIVDFGVGIQFGCLNVAKMNLGKFVLLWSATWVIAFFLHYKVVKPHIEPAAEYRWWVNVGFTSFKQGG